MKKLTQLTLSLISALLILTGCWDKNELNDLAIATGIAIDKSEEGYSVSIQTVNPSEVSTQTNTSGISPITVRTEVGATMYDAIRKLSTTNSKRLYGTHLQLLVISEDIAKEGIADVLDNLSRDNNFRADFLIVITKDADAKDILKMQTVTDHIPTKALTSLLEISEEIWGGSLTISFKELLAVLTIPGRSAVIPMIDTKGDLAIGQTKANTESSAPPVTYKYIGSGIFHKDQLIGLLNAEEVKSYNFIRDEIKQIIEVITCSNDEKMSIEVLRSKTKQKAIMMPDNKPKIKVTIESVTKVGESNCQMDLSNPAIITELERLTEEKIHQDLADVIEKVQTEFKTDVFGFGETIYRSYPKVWSEMSNNWDEHFANLAVEINVSVTNIQLGSTNNALQEDIKE